MKILNQYYRKFSRWSGILVIAMLLGSFAAAQTSSPAATEEKQSEPAKATVQETPAAKKISATEAEQLFGEVDQILKFVSKETGLPVKHEVKRRLTTQDAVVTYLQKSMEDDKSEKRVERSALVLQKFGLLPHDFKLTAFMIALLREQIAGYYDPKTKFMNLLDWVPAGKQRPVLAHELMHALQDQSFGVEKWMKAGDIDIDKKKEITPADIVADETAETKQAVVEGQAEAVMLDYILAPGGKSVVNSPEVIAAFDMEMMNGSADSVEFRNAPIFLKESLTFPYRYGVKFVIAVQKDGGKDKAFAGVFANPPRITRQIMQPETYLSGEVIPSMPVPDFKKLFQNYERFDVGSMGEFDVSMLIHQYAGAAESRKMYPHWRGGYYYAGKPKKKDSAPLGLLYVSRWADAEKASRFAAIYAKSLTQRYKKVNAASDNSVDLTQLDTLSGKHAWQTDEGTVVIEVQGDTVMAAESLDADTTEAIEKAVYADMTATK